jgi:hypothetical protein
MTHTRCDYPAVRQTGLLVGTLTAVLTISALTIALPTARAEVGDPTIETDHPHYPGEGAFQTIEDCVRFATKGKDSIQDRAIAQFLWLLTHQFHLASPQEFQLAGLSPDTQNSNADDLIVYDANRGRFSYAYGLCGTVHAWNEPYWRALGLRVRRRAFPGHVNSEIEYDGSWHAYDTDMAGLIFRPDGQVAGYDDLIANPGLIDSRNGDLPCYPFAWPGDFNVMKQGWKKVAEGGNWYKLYNSGYAAHPGVVHLRSGETFTRYFDRDHFGGPSERRFWHNQQGGPFRNWTFVNRGTPRHEGAEANSRGNASYCNGEFLYRPSLADGKFREGTATQSANLAFREESPRLYSRDRRPAEVVFEHFAPYVICGKPQDGANPMTQPATDGFVISGRVVGPVRLEVSADQRQSWQDVGRVSGRFEKDLTDLVKGRYGWHVRFSWQDGGGLDELSFTTVTQVSQVIYPRLTAGGSEVTYRAASRGVTAVLPDFTVPASQTPQCEEIGWRSKNVAYRSRRDGSRNAYETTDNQPGTVAFRVAAPSRLQEVRAAVRFSIRVPPPENCDFHMEISTDEGRTWQEFARADVPTDNEFSSGWMYGKADVSAAQVNSALVRAHLYAGGYRTGLITAQLYGVHETAAAQPLNLTYAWKEGDQVKTHVEHIAAGTTEKAFDIPTGDTIADYFVRMEAVDE